MGGGGSTITINEEYLISGNVTCQDQSFKQADDKIWYMNVKNDTNTIKMTDPASFIVTGKLMTPLETVEKGKEKKIAFMESADKSLSGLISYQCGDKQLVVLFYKASTNSDSDPPLCALSIENDKKILDASLYNAMHKVMENSAAFTRKAISESEHMQSLEIYGLKVIVTRENNAFSVNVRN